MPDLEDELGCTCDKNTWDKGVPLDVVDGGGVGRVGPEVLGGVLGGRKVD